MSFTNVTTGKAHAFGGKYLELVPGERIRYTDSFEDPNLPGEMTTTVTLNPCQSAPSSTSSKKVCRPRSRFFGLASAKVEMIEVIGNRLI